MREIKFRCWNKHWHEMYDWEIMCDDGLNNYMSEDDIWLQYTGLKDKNGVEVYEGDIVHYKCKSGYLRYDMKCQITWGHGAYYFCNFNFNNMPGILSDYENQKYLEVIGNKYENPELLEDSE